MKHPALCLLASAIILAWNCPGDSDGALLRAVRRDDAERVKRLLDGGADANAVNGKGRTALGRAVQRGNKEVVELLLAHGARVGRESGRLSEAELAVVTGHREILERFLDEGVDVHEKNPYGQTLLHLAAVDGRVEIIRMLLARGVDPNVRDDSGATPLFHAAGMGWADAVQVLLEAGADADAPEAHGNTPLKVAAAEEHIDVVLLLRKHLGIETLPAGQDSWYREPEEISYIEFYEHPLSREAFAAVAESEQERAQARLKESAFVEIAEAEAREWAGAALPIQAEKRFFLVRGLFYNRDTGEFALYRRAGKLLVHHTSLGHGIFPMQRRALVVQLDRPPREVYVSCDINE